MKSRYIFIRSGETLTIKSTANGTSPRTSVIRDTQGMHVLPIQWISQHGPTATHTADDCGSACIAMATHYLTDQNPTVDQVSAAGEIPTSATWSSLRQLQRAARTFGLRARFIRPLMPQHIKDQIQHGKPCIALVKYDEIQTTQPPRAHFILLVGYSPESVIYHDPNLDPGDFIEINWKTFRKAHGSTAKTAGNTFNNHGIIFA